MTSDSAARLLAQIDDAWRPFREAVETVDLNGSLPAGWTAKEMLAHVAFWDEAVMPVVVTMFRGNPLPPGFHFGSGFQPDPDAWPAADIHNAREAAWARGTTGVEVFARLDGAHAAVLATIATVTDPEAAAHLNYFAQLGQHYCAHLPDLHV